MASSGVTTHLPPVKSVVVYRNGDPFYSGRRFVINQRQISTMEVFLNDITHSIGAPLAVRTLYTPRYGHRVSDLTELQQGAQYVAAGFERFKKLDYLRAGLKRVPVCRAVETAQERALVRPNVSAKWRKVITLPCIIHVFRNGDVLSPAMRFIIPRNMQRNLEQIFSLISEKAMLRTGAMRRLCTLEGITVTSTEELQSGQCYVAVGTERFKKLPYVEILINKATGSSADRHYAGDRGLHRRIESRKVFPQDSHSDSTLLDSPERDGRRIKSTGDEMERDSPPQPVKRRERRAGKNDNSVFYARPVRVRRHPPTQRAPPKATANEPSVFKASDSSNRREIVGAEEVADDENTTVELPVDQREPEIVEDDELPEKDQFETANMNHTGVSNEQQTTRNPQRYIHDGHYSGLQRATLFPNTQTTYTPEPHTPSPDLSSVNRERELTVFESETQGDSSPLLRETSQADMSNKESLHDINKHDRELATQHSRSSSSLTSPRISEY